MPIYSIDVRIYGTAYIRADSEEAAQEIADNLKGDEVRLASGGEIDVSDLQYDDPDLPDVSLSPVATCQGPDDGEAVDEAEV